MGQFKNFQHKRFRIIREEFPVTVTADARPAPPFKSILGDKDWVTIYFDRGDHVASVSLTEEEVDGLIFELSRLKRFHDPKNHVDKAGKP